MTNARLGCVSTRIRSPGAGRVIPDRSREVASPQEGIRQIGPREIGIREIGGVVQVGVGQSGTGEIGVREIGAVIQVSVGEVRTAKVRSNRRRIRRVNEGTNESRVRQIGSIKIDSG